jgi:hypothetical protein
MQMPRLAAADVAGCLPGAGTVRDSACVSDMHLDVHKLYLGGLLGDGSCAMLQVCGHTHRAKAIGLLRRMLRGPPAATHLTYDLSMCVRPSLRYADRLLWR